MRRRTTLSCGNILRVSLPASSCSIRSSHRTPFISGVLYSVGSPASPSCSQTVSSDSTAFSPPTEKEPVPLLRWPFTAIGCAPGHQPSQSRSSDIEIEASKEPWDRAAPVSLGQGLSGIASDDGETRRCLADAKCKQATHGGERL